MEENSSKRDSKYNAVGWVRMQKNKKDGTNFFLFSLEDGTRGLLRLDKKLIAQVQQDDKLLGEKVIGLLLVEKNPQGGSQKRFQKKITAPVSNDTDLPF